MLIAILRPPDVVLCIFYTSIDEIFKANQKHLIETQDWQQELSDIGDGVVGDGGGDGGMKSKWFSCLWFVVLEKQMHGRWIWKFGDIASTWSGVYTCSDFFSKVCSFYCYSDYAFVRAFSEFYLRFFFSALLNSSVDVVCYSFFVCVALCFFSFSLPKWTQLHAALVMHHWAWRELSIFHTAIALSNGSINILRLLFQYSHQLTKWLRAQNQSNFATKYTSWRIKNALALNQIKLLYHQIFDFVFNSDYWSSNIYGYIEHAASSNIQFNWLRSNLFLYFQ